MTTYSDDDDRYQGAGCATTSLSVPFLILLALRRYRRHLSDLLRGDLR